MEKTDPSEDHVTVEELAVILDGVAMRRSPGRRREDHEASLRVAVLEQQLAVVIQEHGRELGEVRGQFVRIEAERDQLRCELRDARFQIGRIAQGFSVLSEACAAAVDAPVAAALHVVGAEMLDFVAVA